MLLKNNKRPICLLCNIRPARACGESVKGFTKWRKYCSSCDSKKYRKQLLKKNQCEICNFKSIHLCQLDLVKLDKKYLTLCANCNRLRIQNEKQKNHDNYEITVDATVDLNDITI